MRPKNAGMLFVAILIIVGGIFALHEERGRIHDALDALSLLPKEEHYTELYFSDPSELPRFFIPGVEEKISFTVGNHEGEDRDYSYEAFFLPKEISGTTTPLLRVVTFSLPAGEYATRTILFSLDNKNFTEGDIVIRLIQTDEEIHFHIKRTGL